MKTTCVVRNVTAHDAEEKGLSVQGICLTTGALEAMLCMDVLEIVARLQQEGETAAIEMANIIMTTPWTMLVMRRGDNKVLDAQQFKSPTVIQGSQDSAASTCLGVSDAL